MKNLVQVLLTTLSLILAVNVQADIPIDASDIPLTVCAGQWGFIDASGMIDSYDWSEKSFGLHNQSVATWSPNQAGVHIRSHMDGIYEIRVRF